MHLKTYVHMLNVCSCTYMHREKTFVDDITRMQGF
jgi:hypothetical protein